MKKMSDGQFWILVLFTIITICYLTLILFEELENRKKNYRVIKGGRNNGKRLLENKVDRKFKRKK